MRLKVKVPDSLFPVNYRMEDMCDMIFPIFVAKLQYVFGVGDGVG